MFSPSLSLRISPNRRTLCKLFALIWARHWCIYSSSHPTLASSTGDLCAVTMFRSSNFRPRVKSQISKSCFPKHQESTGDKLNWVVDFLRLTLVTGHEVKLRAGGRIPKLLRCGPMSHGTVWMNHVWQTGLQDRPDYTQANERPAKGLSNCKPGNRVSNYLFSLRLDHKKGPILWKTRRQAGMGFEGKTRKETMGPSDWG